MNEHRITLNEELQEYESKSKIHLTKKVPVFIRVDGKAFKTFTKGFKKPYDELLSKTMMQTMQAMCEEIQGCVFGYTASDEITIILTDYHKWNSEPWLNYDAQKMSSEAASIATEAFNRFFNENRKVLRSPKNADEISIYEAYERACTIGARFEARCFNVPEDRVCEMIFWRQNNHRRNVIQSIGRLYFSRKELLGKCNDEVLDMLYEKEHIVWNNLPVVYRIGACCTKGKSPFVGKKSWSVDKHMPMICDENKAYLQEIMDSIREPEVDDE